MAKENHASAKHNLKFNQLKKKCATISLCAFSLFSLVENVGEVEGGRCSWHIGIIW